MNYIRGVFHHQMNHLLWVINKIINKGKQKTKVANKNNDESSNKKHQLVVHGDKGTQILRLMEEYIRNLLSKKSSLKITCTKK